MAVLHEIENNSCGCGNIFCPKCYRIVRCFIDNDDEFVDFPAKEWDELPIGLRNAIEIAKSKPPCDFDFEEVWEFWNRE